MLIGERSLLLRRQRSPTKGGRGGCASVLSMRHVWIFCFKASSSSKKLTRQMAVGRDCRHPGPPHSLALDVKLAHAHA
eukprot:5120545-Alexandrium_andersonii.AAC.1